MQDIIKKDNQFIANTYKRQQIVIKEGHGSIAIDSEGNKYIDFAAGIAVNILGYSDKKWARAVAKQARELSHTSNLYYTEPCVRLAEYLCDKTGFKKVFFTNSGAEANETAIKCARKYSIEKYNADRYEIITFNNGFHGRTYGALSATAQEKFQAPFKPMLDGFKYIDCVDINQLKNAISDNTAAVIIELVQGEGGVNVLDKTYVKKLASILKRKDILLIIDEVQTGNGRTGSLFSYMQYDITPDIVTTAKGLGGGLPIGAVMFNEKTQSVLSYGDHGTTFGANPICCAGALSIVKRLDRKLLNRVKEQGEQIKKTISLWKNVEYVSGLGYMIGIKTNKNAADIVELAAKNGLLVITAKDKIRLLPPLNISQEDLTKGLGILKEIIEK